jgi:hypothetical protein
MYGKKVEYLKGLMAGLSLDPNTNEYKLFTAVIDALDAFAGVVSDIEEDVTDLEDTIDNLNDELDDITELMDSLEAFDEEDNIRQFPSSGGLDGDDEGEYEITCPGCEHVFIVDEDTILAGNVVCPACKEKLAFDISGGCGCGKCPGAEAPCNNEEE